MCGIAGIAGRPGTLPDPAALASLRAALAHRGPDGSAQISLGPAGLVHTRLAIIDLKTGDQPLVSQNGMNLIGNGEIYNYVELRDEFPPQVLRSQSDFEPALHVLDRDGAQGIDRLRGMYAIAAADRDGRTLLLARDPFGIKPLYLCDTPSGIAFASQPAALIQAGYARPALNLRARDEFLNVQYVNGTETIFTDIRNTDPRARELLGASLSGGDFEDEAVLLEGARRPVAVLHGVDDQFVRLSFLQGLQIPNLWEGKVHTIASAGHAVQLEQPVRFNRFLERFASAVAG